VKITLNFPTNYLLNEYRFLMKFSAVSNWLLSVCDVLKKPMFSTKIRNHLNVNYTRI